MAANAFLAARVRELSRPHPVLEELARVQSAIAEARERAREKPYKAPDGATVTLALQLGDCAACFGFLTFFGSACSGREERCEILLLGSTPGEVEELKTRFGLAMKVSATQSWPPAVRAQKLPAVWVSRGEQRVFVEGVPVSRLEQAELALRVLQALT